MQTSAYPMILDLQESKDAEIHFAISFVIILLQLFTHLLS